MTSNRCDQLSRKSEPSTLTTATGVPSRAGTTISPRPGAADEKFAGRTTRSVVSIHVAISGRRQVWLPSVIASAPAARSFCRQLRRQADAVGDVLTVDDADVDVELLPQGRQSLLDHAAAGVPDDVGDEEEDQGTLRDAAGYACSVTWFPASCVKRARACRSTCDRSSTIPSRVEPAATDSPTVRAGSGAQPRHGDDQRRRGQRPDVEPHAARPAVRARSS